MKRIFGLMLCICTVLFVVACTQTKEVGSGVAEEKTEVIATQSLEEETSNEPILELSNVGEKTKNNYNYAKYTNCDITDEYVQVSVETDMKPTHVVQQTFDENGEPLDPSLNYVDFGVAGDKVGIMFHRDKTVENDSVSFLLMNEDCPTIVKINVDLREY